MARLISKQALIGVEIVFSSESTIEHERVDSNYPHNFISITSLSAIEGVHATPTAGVYNIYVKTSKSSGYESILDNGEVDARLTGGDGLADGESISASFDGNPYAVKVVPVGVDVALAYEVNITQNVT
jgi:hypothetical protein